MKNSKSGFAIVGTVILILVQIVMGVAQFSNSSSSSSSSSDQHRDLINKMSERQLELEGQLTKNIPIYLMTGQMAPAKELMQLQKDSVFPVAPNINVHLPERIHLQDPSISPTIQLFAKITKFYFFYDRVEKSTEKSITEQWESLRRKLSQRMVPGSRFSYKNKKNYTVKNLNIEEKEFKITYAHLELQGVARLIETEDTRYFFHFLSKEKAGKEFYTDLAKGFLDNFLKIE